MAANLYARSIFGEDALANVSIEKPIHLGPDAPVNGHIRIRAKSQVGLKCCINTYCCLPPRVKALGEFHKILSFLKRISSYVFGIPIFKSISLLFPQGMALSLGDKINLSQKKTNL